MESSLSMLSSLKDDGPPLFIQPHYKEAYRLAIYALLCGGPEAYREYLRAEQVHSFLSEEEIHFILENAKQVVVDDGERGPEEVSPSTYFPTLSDEEVPDLELGWPEVRLQETDTSISLLYHPPRKDTPTIKEVVRSQIQAAREVIAIAMDVFTDINIFKEVLQAALRGVAVYILLDDAQVAGFLHMSRSVGIDILRVQNICVRTVRGPEYQCQSGMKFHGGLEQKFMLVDGRTVLYGSYSFSWSFEKINLSMVLVITGQLVSSFDEEFRRVYARSIIPVVPPPPLRRAGLQGPASSPLFLNRKPPRGFGNGGVLDGALSRGLSVQDRLHQSHRPDPARLLRGHSCGGELQRVSSMTRLRMGTKDLGGPPDCPPHQNLMPFSSESSLHRPALGGPPEFQSQWVHQRSREIWSRMEVGRQKRRSLQENFRHSQESLRSVRSALDRPNHLSKSPDMRHSVLSLVPLPRGAEPAADADGRRSASQHDLRTELHGRNHPAPSKPDGDLPRPGGLSVQHRGNKSLFEIPEEREGPSSVLNATDPEAGGRNQPGAETVPADPPKDPARPEPNPETDHSTAPGEERNGLTSEPEGRDVDRKSSSRTEVRLEVLDGERGTSDPEDVQNLGSGPGNSSSSPGERTPRKERSPGPPRSPSKLVNPKSPFSKRSSKRNLSAEPHPDRRSCPDGERGPASQSKRERGPHPDLHSSRSSGSDRPSRRAEKSRSSSSMSRQDGGPTAFQTHADNKLGRFMQRVGHLIHKNK